MGSHAYTEMAASICVFLFALVVGLQADNFDNRNITVECVFKSIGPCFNSIPGLAGDFSARYNQNATELNQTCRNNVFNYRFPQCIELIPGRCPTPVSVMPEISLIELFIRTICKNGSVEQNNFINSSVCYNQFQIRRQHCVRQYATTKDDAKSLCCSSRKTQDCLKKDLKGVCSKNDTDFQDHLIDIYSTYTNLLCKQYDCGAASNFLSLASFVLVAIVAHMNWVS